MNIGPGPLYSLSDMKVVDSRSKQSLRRKVIMRCFLMRSSYYYSYGIRKVILLDKNPDLYLFAAENASVYVR